MGVLEDYLYESRTTSKKVNPTVDAASDALRKLTSGGTLNDAERALLNMGPATKPNLVVEDVLSNDGKIIGEGNDGDGQGEDLIEKPLVKKLISTYTNPTSGDIVDVYDNGDGTTSESIRQKGTTAIDAAAKAAEAAATRRAQGQSAYDLLSSKFAQYGLESLVGAVKDLIVTGASEAQLTMALRDTPEYQKRFAGNAARIQKGLKALDEATYVELEDQYQNVMRNYGLPASYWAKDSIGTQKGFTDLIANDVSATELESRVQKAQDFIDKSPTEYVDAVKEFYPEISRGDLMAYVLDPKNALTSIQAKIGAAQIGGEYLRAGLDADVARAEELQRQGVTAEKARLGAQAIQDIAPRGGELADIYNTGPYGQAEVEAEAYGLANASEAKKKREKLVDLETAAFSGKSGVGVLGRDTGGLY